jgi:hypothetical protein
MLTEIVTLPSKGNLYPKESPLSSGQVEVKYMTTKEEDILTTQSYIESGVVLDKLLESVIVTKGVKVSDLSVGDKQAVLLQTRILGYGNDYSIKVGGKVHTIDLGKLDFVGKPEFFDNNPFINYELPKSKKKVTLKVLSSGEASTIQKEIDSIKEKGISVGEVSMRLPYIIVDVDGNTDQNYIRKFVNEELLAIDSLGIRTFLELVTPDINFTAEIGGEEVDIPIGINFFYPSFKS